MYLSIDCWISRRYTARSITWSGSYSDTHTSPTSTQLLTTEQPATGQRCLIRGTREKSSCTGQHRTNFLEGLHFRRRGLWTYWPATTHEHHPHHTSQVLSCWSIHGPQPSTQIHCGPLTEGLELKFGPTLTNLARRVESDVTPLNTGLATAYHRAQNRQAWRSLVEMATSIWQATWWWWWWWRWLDNTMTNYFSAWYYRVLQKQDYYKTIPLLHYES